MAGNFMQATALLAALFLSFSSYAETSTEATVAQPVEAEPRLQSYEWMSLAEWYRLHASQIELALTAKPDVLFLGDSITASWQWDAEHSAVFNKYFGSYKTANFAIGGDRAENVLWRLRHGIKGNITPKVVVNLIGVNNIGQTKQSPATIFANISEVVNQIHNNYPDAKILLIGIFPFGADAQNPNRKTVKEINSLLTQLSDLDYVSYYDFGEHFLQPNGNISPEIMADGLHLTPAGLDIFGQQLAPKVEYALNQFGRQSNWIAATDDKIQISGRAAKLGEKRVDIGFPGVSVKTHFNAKKLSLLAKAKGDVYFDVLLDDHYFRTIKIPEKPKKIALFEATNAAPHTIELIKRTETWQGIATVMGMEVRDGELLPPPPLPSRKLLVIGDSITCGEGVQRPTEPNAQGRCEKEPIWWDARNSYGYQLAKALDAQVQLVCFGGRGLVRDWQGRTDTMTVPDVYETAVPSEPTALPWEQKNYQADLILAMIGTNDFSQSAGDPPQKQPYTSAYLKFIKKLLVDHPSAEIVLTDGPMLNNNDEKTQHKSLLLEYLYQTQKSSKSDRVYVIPTRTIAADECDAHPAAAGHAQIAKDFEPLIRNLMGWPMEK